MRPRRLVLENVGPFIGRLDLDFTSLDDIFLIAGKTGAGKTTIFDSICYALYGSLPGSRKGYAGKLKSDFASDDAECSVSLEFDLGGRVYRVERSPKQEKRKKRGTGTTVVDETAALYEIENGALLPLSGKKTEADERIRSLIGLSEAEFSKIVLLPQGEFAEFLRQNTTERREVLRKLFPVELAVRVREIAQERSRDASARLAEAEQALVRQGERFSPEEYDAERSRAVAELDRSKETSGRLEREFEDLSGVLRAAEAEKEARRRLSEAMELEAGVASRSDEMAELEARLSASRTARPMEELLIRENETAAEASRAREAARDAARHLELRNSAFLALEATGVEIERRQDEASALRERRGPLAEAAQAEASLKEDEAKLGRLDAERDDLESSIQGVERDEALKTAELKGAREKADQADILDEACEAAREAMERAKATKPIAERAERLDRETRSAKERATTVSAECAELEARLPVLEAEIAILEAERKASDEAGSAAALAAKLEVGKPCPVCGSLNHPAPAGAPKLSFGLVERIEAQKRSRDEAIRRLASRQADLSSANRELERVGKERAELLAQHAFFADEVPLPSAADAQAQLQARIAALNAAVAPRDEARRARARVNALYHELEVCTRTKADLISRRSELQEARATLTASIGERRNRRDQAIAATGAGDSRGDASAALSALDARLGELDAEVKKQRDALELAGRELSAAEARSGAMAAAAHEAEQASLRAAEKLGAALLDSPFSDAVELRAALMPAAAESAAEETISTWKEELLNLRGRRSELERALSLAQEENVAASGRGPEAISEALAALRGQRETAELARDTAAATLAALDREKAAYDAAADRRGTLAEETSRMKRLSDDLSGNNPKKRAFDSWLLALYLEEVAAYASRRLERMSEGRFSLMLDAEGEGGRGRSGLDLSVFDAYTGRARPCATLSGGESFMASISLALGLADSIQARSGGIRLDAVFIDEGFGSLDEASLDRALGILDEIRDHRMVGLISHVGEMRGRIPSRVEVVKSGSGSHIRIGR